VFRTPEWTEWQARKRRFLWLHGIPGAGKTVLSSYLIKKLEAEHEDEQRTVVVYYYCYFGHIQDEAMPFLSWILSQLCRKARKVSSNILRLKRDGHRPDEHDILEALQDIVQEFEVVYIVIDAVDESRCRENLISVLLKLARDDSFCKIQLLAASREYQDLDDAFRPVAGSLSLSHGEVEKDIRTYIHAQLDRRPAKIKSWSPVLIQDVEDTLAAEAKGM
jgi:Cdc6-like AAA superfamily ATPase